MRYRLPARRLATANNVRKSRLPYEPIVEDTVVLERAHDTNGAVSASFSARDQRRLLRWLESNRAADHRLRDRLRRRKVAADTSRTNEIDALAKAERSRRRCNRARVNHRYSRSRAPRRVRRAGTRVRRAATDSGGSSDGDGPPARRLRRRPRGPPRAMK